MAPFESLRLETSRLTLRPPRLEDLDAWAEMMGDEPSARFIGGTAPREVCWRQLMTMIGSWHSVGFAMFSVIEKATGQWVGRLGPWQPEGWPGTEVGWSIARAHWGKGFAPEGARAATNWAFDQLGWSEVIHTIAGENINSKVVAAKLGSGFLRMGELPAPHDGKPVEIWGQSRAEWMERRKLEGRA